MLSPISPIASINALSALRDATHEYNSLARIAATGKRVNDASDDPVSWAAGASLRAESAVLSEGTRIIAVGQAKLTEMQSQVDATLKVLDNARVFVVQAAADPSIDHTAGLKEIQKTLASVRSELAVTAAKKSPSSIVLGPKDVIDINTPDMTVGVDALDVLDKAIATLLAPPTANGMATPTATIKATTANSPGQASMILHGTTDPSATTLELKEGSNTLAVVGAGGAWEWYYNNVASGTHNITLVSQNSSGQTSLTGQVAITVDAAGNATAVTPSAAPDFAGLLKSLDTTEKAVTNLGASVGAAANRLDTTNSFLESRIKFNDQASSAMLDADMDEVSAKLTAAQVRMSLANTMLSITNNNTQMILSLFQS